MSYITKKHVSRRTLLKGMGVTVALPFLDGMVPARTAYAKSAAGAAASKTRLVAIEMVHGAAGSAAIGIQKNLWAPAAAGHPPVAWHERSGRLAALHGAQGSLRRWPTQQADHAALFAKRGHVSPSATASDSPIRIDIGNSPHVVRALLRTPH